MANKIIKESVSPRKVGVENIDYLWWLERDKSAFTKPLADWKQDGEKFLSFVKDRNTVIQAGGNCGMYARFYGNYFDTVYSFEPNKDNFYCLSMNCQEEKYKIFNVCLGAKNTKAKLFKSKEKPTNCGIWQTKEDTSGEIDVVTIDGLELNTLNLIHLDVEGYEKEVLTGAIESIKKFLPVVILEAGHGSEIINSIGYSIKFKGRMDWVYTYDR